MSSSGSGEEGGEYDLSDMEEQEDEDSQLNEESEEEQEEANEDEAMEEDSKVDEYLDEDEDKRIETNIVSFIKALIWHIGSKERQDDQ